MSAPSGYTALDFVGFTDKGTYSPSATYMRNDLVHYGGNIMRCLIDNTTNVTPVVGANWELWVGASANLVERVIAPLENNPADVAYGVGRQIIYDDWLWEVIAPIAVGDALVDYAVDPINANIKKSAPVETQLLAVKAEADATDNMIAPTETNASSSSAAYAVGDQLILNNVLYTVTTAITIGDALVSGTGGNIEASDSLTDQLANEVNTVNSALTTVKPTLVQNTDITSVIADLFSAGKKLIYLPSGTYSINNLSIPDGCGIIGDNTTITSTTAPTFRLASNTVIKNMSITNSDVTAYSSGIECTNGKKNIEIENVTFSGNYIGIYIKNNEHVSIRNCTVSNAFENGICIYADGASDSTVSNCTITGDYSNGSHAIQFSGGSYNKVELCHIACAGVFCISLYNENLDVVNANYCHDSHYEAINLDNCNRCVVSNNNCMWQDANRPSSDHAITIFGGTAYADCNKVYGNNIYGSYRAGIAIAGGARNTEVFNNVMDHTNLEGSSSGIKGAIELYQDNSEYIPSFSMISNNIIRNAPIYGVEEKAGYRNVISDNITIPVKKDYITQVARVIDRNAMLSEVTPTLTPTTSGGTLVRHKEFWDGEFICGEFVADFTSGTNFIYNIGITPANYSLFMAHLVGGVICPIYIDGSGNITVSPNFTATGVSVTYRYRTDKHFS